MINYELSSFDGVVRLEKNTAEMIKKQTLLAAINCLEKIVNLPFIANISYIDEIDIFSRKGGKQFYLYFNAIPNNVYEVIRETTNNTKEQITMENQIQMNKIENEIEKMKYELAELHMSNYDLDYEKELDESLKAISLLKQRTKGASQVSLEQNLSLIKPMHWFVKPDDKELNIVKKAWLFEHDETIDYIDSFLKLFLKNTQDNLSIANKLKSFITDFGFINKNNFNDFKAICFEPIMPEYEAHLLDKSLPNSEIGGKALKI